jgi:phospholipid/cholesterol/gamma-HCH transport system permease protein
VTLSHFIGRIALAFSHGPPRPGAVIRQIEFFAWQSLPMVLFCVCFAAVVTIIESSFHMKLVIQNDGLVPGFAAVLILRELGAVVSALLLTARAGAGLAAELGSMQVTEQIDALRMLGIDPVRYLVLPRLCAGVIGGTLVSIFANLACLYAAMLVTQYDLGYSSGSFVTGMRAFVHARDLYFAALKGAAFGAVIPLASCYYGLRCREGAEGVGQATTHAVVAASVTIIGLDFVLTYVFSHFY